MEIMTSREFNQDAGRAKREAERGPVLITDRGRPAHVLLTFEAYQRLLNAQPSIVDQLAMPEAASLEFEPPRLGPIAQVPDLS